MKLFGLVKKINKDIKQKITILIFCSLYVCCLKKKSQKFVLLLIHSRSQVKSMRHFKTRKYTF